MSAITLRPTTPPNQLVASFQHLQPSLPDALTKIGVRHARWIIANVNLEGVDLKNPTEGLISQILRGNNVLINRVYDFCTPHGSLDIVKINPEIPNLEELLVKFAAIHDHSAPEIRLILDGEGIFYIYVEEEKYEIVVRRGDFLYLPAETPHNFTLTEARSVVALRVFQDKDGGTPRARQV